MRSINNKQLTHSRSTWNESNDMRVCTYQAVRGFRKVDLMGLHPRCRTVYTHQPLQTITELGLPAKSTVVWACVDSTSCQFSHQLLWSNNKVRSMKALCTCLWETHVRMGNNKVHCFLEHVRSDALEIGLKDYGKWSDIHRWSWIWSEPHRL